MNTNDIRKRIEKMKMEHIERSEPHKIDFQQGIFSGLDKALILIPPDHVLIKANELEQLKREKGFWEKQHQKVAMFCMLECQRFHKKDCKCRGCEVAHMTVDWKTLKVKP